MTVMFQKLTAGLKAFRKSQDDRLGRLRQRYEEILSTGNDTDELWPLARELVISDETTLNRLFAKVVEAADAHFAAVLQRAQSGQPGGPSAFPAEMQAIDSMLAAMGRIASALKRGGHAFGAARDEFCGHIRDGAHAREMLNHAAAVYHENDRRLTLGRKDATQGEPLTAGL